MQVEWTKSEKGTKYGTKYEVLEGSFRWSQTIICSMTHAYPGKATQADLPMGCPGPLIHDLTTTVRESHWRSRRGSTCYHVTCLAYCKAGHPASAGCTMRCPRSRAPPASSWWCPRARQQTPTWWSTWRARGITALRGACTWASRSSSRCAPPGPPACPCKGGLVSPSRHAPDRARLHHGAWYGSAFTA